MWDRLRAKLGGELLAEFLGTFVLIHGRTGIPLKAWKAAQEKLTAERKELSRRYLALKDEVKEAEQIRKGVYAILREENRKEQPAHKQDLDR